MNKNVFTLFLLMFISIQGWACSCIGPDTFVNSIGRLILQVEVIDVQALDTSRYAYTVTRLKVNKVIKGEYALDTLLILNDKGFECFHSLPYREKGRQYIVTGNLLDEWSNLANNWAASLEGKMMVLNLCSENYLFFKDNRVSGNITKNKSKKRGLTSKVHQFILPEAVYGNWIAKRRSASKREKKLQKMPLKKFEKKLKESGKV